MDFWFKSYGHFNWGFGREKGVFCNGVEVACRAYVTNRATNSIYSTLPGLLWSVDALLPQYWTKLLSQSGKLTKFHKYKQKSKNRHQTGTDDSPLINSYHFAGYIYFFIFFILYKIYYKYRRKKLPKEAKKVKGFIPKKT